MELRWYGTATLFIDEDDTSLLFDPYVPLNKNIDAFRKEMAAESDNIFITHGHFDHLVDVPDIVNEFGQMVHCSRVAADTLAVNGVDRKQIDVISPGDRLKIGPFNIRVLRGRHIRFDLKLILRTIFNRRMIDYRSELKTVLSQHRAHPAGDILVFEVEAEGKNILHMGSLNLDRSEKYPETPDLLTLAFQGRSDLNEYALDFLSLIKPKSVYLHHFDDAFPPISSAVDTREFVDIVQNLFPGIHLIVPEYGEVVRL